LTIGSVRFVGGVCSALEAAEKFLQNFSWGIAKPAHRWERDNIKTDLVNKTNLVHNLFLVYLSISTCFGRLCAHHQEKQLCFCDTWYLLLCVDDYLVCTLHTRQSSTQNNKYKVSQKHNCFSWWWAHSRPKHVEIDKYANNKLCTNLVLFTRLYRDARSTEHKIKTDLHYTAWVRLFWIHMALVRGNWWNAVKFL